MSSPLTRFLELAQDERTRYSFESKTIRLEITQPSSSEMEQVIEALANNKHVEIVDFTNVHITDSILLQLRDLLLANLKLKRLAFPSNILALDSTLRNDIENLLYRNRHLMLEQFITELKSRSEAYCQYEEKVSHEEAIEIANFLKANTSLQTVSFGHCLFTQQDAQLIADVFDCVDVVSRDGFDSKEEKEEEYVISSSVHKQMRNRYLRNSAKQWLQAYLLGNPRFCSPVFEVGHLFDEEIVLLFSELKDRKIERILLNSPFITNIGVHAIAAYMRTHDTVLACKISCQDVVDSEIVEEIKSYIFRNYETLRQVRLKTFLHELNSGQRTVTTYISTLLAEECQAVYEILKSNIAVINLHCHCLEVNKSVEKLLVDVVLTNQTLQEIKLGSRISADAMNTLSKIPEANVYIVDRTFVLYHNVRRHMLAQISDSRPGYVQIDWTRHRITIRDIESLVSVLISSHKIRTIALPSECITREMEMLLTHALQHNTSLLYINIGSRFSLIQKCILCNKFEYNMHRMERNDPSLTHTTLMFHEETAHRIAAALRSNTNLISLTLISEDSTMEVKLSTFSIEMFTDALESNLTLIALNVKIDESLSQLQVFGYLRRNRLQYWLREIPKSGIYRLNMSAFNIDDSMVAQIASALRNRVTLRFVNLRNNQITDKGAALIAQAVSASAKPITLKLGKNLISASMLSYIDQIERYNQGYASTESFLLGELEKSDVGVLLPREVCKLVVAFGELKFKSSRDPKSPKH